MSGPPSTAPLSVAQAGAVVAAVLAAAAGSAALVVEFEGWRTSPYLDPVGKWTDCAGVTAGAAPGRARSDAECVARTAAALAEHGAAIARCLPAQLPAQTRAAFTAFAYNVGSERFCGSTLARKAQKGDLAGACAELSRWTYAGGRELAGLKRRRAAERALCDRGLAR